MNCLGENISQVLYPGKTIQHCSLIINTSQVVVANQLLGSKKRSRQNSIITANWFKQTYSGNTVGNECSGGLNWILFATWSFFWQWKFKTHPHFRFCFLERKSFTTWFLWFISSCNFYILWYPWLWLLFTCYKNLALLCLHSKFKNHVLSLWL